MDLLMNSFKIQPGALIFSNEHKALLRLFSEETKLNKVKFHSPPKIQNQIQDSYSDEGYEGYESPSPETQRIKSQIKIATTSANFASRINLCNSQDYQRHAKKIKFNIALNKQFSLERGIDLLKQKNPKIFLQPSTLFRRKSYTSMQETIAPKEKSLIGAVTSVCNFHIVRKQAYLKAPRQKVKDSLRVITIVESLKRVATEKIISVSPSETESDVSISMEMESDDPSSTLRSDIKQLNFPTSILQIEDFDKYERFGPRGPMTERKSVKRIQDVSIVENQDKIHDLVSILVRKKKTTSKTFVYSKKLISHSSKDILLTPISLPSQKLTTIQAGMDQIRKKTVTTQQNIFASGVESIRKTPQTQTQTQINMFGSMEMSRIPKTQTQSQMNLFAGGKESTRRTPQTQSIFVSSNFATGTSRKKSLLPIKVNLFNNNTEILPSMQNSLILPSIVSPKRSIVIDNPKFLMYTHATEKFIQFGGSPTKIKKSQQI